MDNRTVRGLSAVKLALASREARASETRVLAAAEPVAVIGMGCRLPGNVSTLESFWRMLVEGADLIREVPHDRWDIDALYDPDAAAQGKMNTRWGGFLEEPAVFDPQFFGIAPREAASMDPQQRLLLEVAWEAIEDAGLPAPALTGAQVGLFFSIYNTDYAEHLGTSLESIDAYTTLGTAPCMASGRLSFLFDFKGPSLVVDTACSSSLVATHLAIQSLREGSSDVALVGASSLILTPSRTVSLSRWGFMAPDGRCKFGDARADGWVRGEGCGVIVLKRLSDALADADRVYAVLRGSAVNQDGRSTVLTAPNGLSQEAVIRAALAAGLVDASEVTYVEAHGTGTTIGDPIELEALAATYGVPRPDGLSCQVGTVKSNIGHLEAAAGVAGLIKTVLAIERGVIPRSLHYQRLNPHVSLDGTRLEVASRERAWVGAPRRMAGISSFGFSGTNAHVIVEEPPRVPAVPADAPGPRVLPLSARAPEALAALARAHADALASPPSADAAWLRDYCYTAAVRRTHHEHRLAAVGESADALAGQLASFARGESARDVVSGEVAAGDPPNVVFVCCGQGPQWWGMGRELLVADTTFREALERVAAALDPLTGWSLLEQFRLDEPATRFAETAVAQPAIFAIQLALAACWRERGVKPSAVLGHSVGEIAAAQIAGALSLEDASRLVAHRSRLMQRVTGQGRMLSVDLPEAEAARLAQRFPGRLDLAAVNGPATCVLSGAADAILSVAASLEAAKIGHQALPVNYAFHSYQVDDLIADLVSALAGLRPSGTSLQMVSTVTGETVAGEALDPAYWGRNLRQPVRLAQAVARALSLAGTSAVFLELGPHPVLAGAIAATLDRAGASAARVLPSMHRKRGERVTMATTLAALHVAGCRIDWNGVFPSGGRVVSLPAYQWQHDRYWVERDAARPLEAPEPDLPGGRLRSPLLRGAAFEVRITPASPAFVGEHRIAGVPVFPATGYLATAFAAVRQVVRTDAPVLSDVVLQAPLFVFEEGATLQTLVETRDGRTWVRIVSEDDAAGQRWLDHFEALVGVRGETLVPPVLDLDAIQARCRAETAGDEHYEGLTRRGYAFSGTFRSLRRVWYRDGESLARLGLAVEPQPASLPFAPGLADGCLQAAVEAITPRLAAGDDSAWLPLTIGRVAVFEAVPRVAWAHATVTAEASGDRVTADLAIAGEDGRVCMSFERLVLVRTPARVIAERAAEARRAADSWLHEQRWVEIGAAPGAGAQDASGGWLVLADSGGLGDRVAARLEEWGGRVVVAVTGAGCRESGPSRRVVRADSADDLKALIVSEAAGGLRGVLFLWGLDAPDPATTDGALEAHAAESCGGLLHLAQALSDAGFADPPRLLVATRGAQPVAGDGVQAILQAPLWGLARTLALEHPEWKCKRVDVDPRHDLPSADQLAFEAVDTNDEDEIGWRLGRRYGARIVRASEVHVGPADADGVTRLVLQSRERGTLENLALDTVARRAPSAGEVEIRVAASSLNFRDVLNALGMYPGDPGPLGNEASGTVTAVGPGVAELAVGDEVVALCSGSFATHLTTPAALVVRRPAGVPADVAASVPIAFLTALHGLRNVANVRAGETVLVHAAAGGVGLAAVQVAQAAGAEVFATAGSDAKRALLRSLGVRHVMDSRSTAFADEVLAATNGRGVDIVLNSLAGDFIPRSLEALANRGRFIEIGKKGIWEPEQVSASRPDVAYHVLFLGDVFATQPDLTREMLRGVLEALAAGQLRPLPLTRFPLERAVDAFRYMAQARHTGKIVLVPPPAASAPPRAVVGIRADATYLVTGGLGALGLHVARALVERGARTLALVARSGPSEAALRTIAELEGTGARVAVVTADVCEAEGVQRVLARLAALPPLAGIVHAAGAVDDGVVEQQTWDRYRKVLAPKMTAAWRLHQAARDLPLDFFVLFSSMASMLGSASQTAYAAGNAFMDALAHVRWERGIPGLSVNWGAWAGAGMAGSLGEHDRERLARQGFQPIEPRAGTDLLFRMLDVRRPQLMAGPVEWDTYTALFPPGARSARFRGLGGAAGGRDLHAAAETRAATPDGGLKARLAATPAAQKLAVVVTTVRQEAATVLGLPAPARLDVRRGLREAGLDSLMAVELRNRLQSAVGRALPATVAFDYPTVEDLARYLAREILGVESDVAPAGEPATAEEMTSAAAAVEELSDDVAEAQLNAELAALAQSRRGGGDA